MDVPLGALSEGFEDRLVLESRSSFARFGGCLLYVLMVPLAFVGSGIVTVLLTVAIETYFAARGSVSGLIGFAFFPIFAVMVGYLFREWQSRDFQEIAVQADRLEVIRGGGSQDWQLSEMLDAKVWPYGLSLVVPSGARFLVQGLSHEKKLAALERVLPVLAAGRRGAIELGEEIRLLPSWKPALHPLSRGLLFGILALLLLGNLHPLLGMVVGLLVVVRMWAPVLKMVRTGGLVLTRTGLRRPGESSSLEIPWSEVESCCANAFFQDTLRVGTRRGKFVWLSERNPVVWALVIQGLQEEGSL